MLLHCAGEVTEDSPECLRRKKRAGAEAYLHGWGPNEYTPTGTLRDYDYTDCLGEIQVPCLVMSGTNDLCTPLVAKTLYDGIQDSKWHLFVGARHMPFAEQMMSIARCWKNGWGRKIKLFGIIRSDSILHYQHLDPCIDFLTY